MGLTAKPNFQILTPLFIEMKICDEILKCPHKDFLSLPRSEKIKLYAYEEMKRKREEFFDKKEMEEVEKLKAKSR